jgi:hypothetical protein
VLASNNIRRISGNIKSMKKGSRRREKKGRPRDSRKEKRIPSM